MIYVYSAFVYLIFPGPAIFVKMTHDSGIKNGYTIAWLIIFALVDLLKIYGLYRLVF